MKRLLAALLLCAPLAAHAAPPSSAVFSIASSATTVAPNLRVQPMNTAHRIGKDANDRDLQTFLRYKGTTANYYLTKSKPVDITDALCLYIEVDQDTKMYLDAESAYILLPAGTRETQCFR